VTATVALAMIVVRAGAFMLFVARYQATRNAGYLVLIAFLIVPLALRSPARSLLERVTPTRGEALAITSGGLDILTIALVAIGAWMVERGSRRAGRARQ